MPQLRLRKQRIIWRRAGADEDLDVLRERRLSSAIFGAAGLLILRMQGARTVHGPHAYFSSDLAPRRLVYCLLFVYRASVCPLSRCTSLIIAQDDISAVSVLLHTGWDRRHSFSPMPESSLPTISSTVQSCGCGFRTRLQVCAVARRI
ncbi:hypothetical protein M433DRAFT_140236 [Acidomyces richmondensis BFW]|nr:MAG: hypothetical protein FE78DRAFT_512478 [Acidomyces sp. 'richmondensis']KYG49225.1 hypothetical protein M433DRAFT_140236 [Acidomyces richmondensis BFW]